MICTEPHKRILVPDRDEYLCCPKLKEGVWFLENANKRNVVKFFSEEEKEEKSKILIDGFISMYVYVNNQYLSHKNNFPQYYVPTYEEANWVHRAIYKGFKNRAWGREDIDPYDGWFGCNVLADKTKSPDVELFRGCKVITISLQGLYTKNTNEYRELWDKRAIRYLCFKDGEKELHETWTGQLPTMEFIEAFIQ